MFHHDMPTTAELFKIFGTLAIVIVIAALMTYFMLIKTIRNLRRGIHEESGETGSKTESAAGGAPANAPNNAPNSAPNSTPDGAPAAAQSAAEAARQP
nr:hypothetical protein [uncultured Ottowia sp.]